MLTDAGARVALLDASDWLTYRWSQSRMVGKTESYLHPTENFGSTRLADGSAFEVSP